MRIRTLATVAAVGAGAVLAVSAGAAARAAQLVVTPARRPPTDLRVLSGGSGNITLTRTKDSELPGRYSLRFAGGAGHAKLGDLVSVSEHAVTRRFLGVDSGDLYNGTRGWIGGWYYWDAAELGIPYEDVEIQTPLGPASAWAFPAPEGAQPGRWAVLVHGRGVDRRECLRAIETFRQAGYSCLAVSYRNDGFAPASDDGRYGLGQTEAADVEAALDWVRARGATSVVMMGFSMGGAIVLQCALRGGYRDLLDGLVLDSPVADWRPTLIYHASAMHMPELAQALSLTMIGSDWARPITGLSEPIDLDALDVVARADELDVPILLMHSLDDGYVPPDASVALAERRPDLVTFDEWSLARHTKLWNADPDRWTSSISGWLTELADRRTSDRRGTSARR